MLFRMSATRARSISVKTVALSCPAVAVTVPQGSTTELCPQAWYLDSGFRAGEAVTT